MKESDMNEYAISFCSKNLNAKQIPLAYFMPGLFPLGHKHLRLADKAFLGCKFVSYFVSCVLPSLGELS